MENKHRRTSFISNKRIQVYTSFISKVSFQTVISLICHVLTTAKLVLKGTSI